MGRSLRARRVAALVASFLLIATACSKSSTSATKSYDVFVQKFRFNGMPATIPSGDVQINFSNKESFPLVHEMILLALPSGKTAADIIESGKVAGCAGGEACENQYLHFGEIPDVSTGATRSQVFHLPPGNYFLACWQQGTQQNPEADTGPTHLAKGMLFNFTVT